VRKPRRPSEARGCGADEGVSAVPTSEQDSDERSDGRNAALSHPPLCSSFFSHASGASARDRGHNAVVISEYEFSNTLFSNTGIRRTRRAGFEKWHSYSLESRGFGFQTAPKEVAQFENLERSEAEAATRSGSASLQTLTQTRGRGCLRSHTCAGRGEAAASLVAALAPSETPTQEVSQVTGSSRPGGSLVPSFCPIWSRLWSDQDRLRTGRYLGRQTASLSPSRRCHSAASSPPLRLRLEARAKPPGPLRRVTKSAPDLGHHRRHRTGHQTSPSSAPGAPSLRIQRVPF
jgi:hypothetical protein